MKKSSHILVLILNTLFCAVIIAAMAIFMNEWGVFLQTAVYALSALSLILGFVFFFSGKDSLLKSLFVLTVCLFIFIAIIITTNQVAHLDKYPDDSAKIERIVEIINSSGSFGKIVYILLQVLQVVVLPLPAVIFYIPGAMIWGPLTATILASIGVLTGCIISFFVGRIFGKKVAIWIIGKEQTEKYCEILGKNGKFPFVMMQILPFFPDDILCIIAGLSSMSFAFFIISMAIIRPIIIAIYCFFGSGVIIPFSGWGIPVWIAIFAVIIVLSVLYFKNREKIENFIASKFKKANDKKARK
ncbi:MAG: TVP38/TMEM64 family protein [Eubacteriales bacterium]